MITKRALIVTVALLALLAAACGQKAPEVELLTGLHHIEIEIADKGVIKAELDADAAPASVTQIVTLAKSGFYDGLDFHRIINGFMMQGGNGEGKGKDKKLPDIKGEFAENGFDNPISHTRGVLSMARTNDPDSANSQFFIVHQDSLFLDGKYAAIGHVTEGMEIVDDICQNTPVTDNNGSVAAADRPVITAIRVTD